MSANTIPVFPASARFEAIALTAADVTNKRLLFTPGANGSRVNAIALCSDDTAAETLKFYLSKDNGVTFFYLGSFVAGIGYEGDASPGIKAFDLANGLALPIGALLYVTALATITEGKTLTVSLRGSDY